MKYLPPKLIDLSLKSIKGDCTGGSADVALCQSGLDAQNVCTTNGTNATQDCDTVGNAVALCFPTGANF